MRRKLFTLLAGFSLLLCVAMCVLWVRSLRHSSRWYWIGPERCVEVTERDGVLGFMFTRDSMLNQSGQPDEARYGFSRDRSLEPPGWDRAAGQIPTFNRWGFGFYGGRTVGHPPVGYWRFGGRRLLIAWVPYWLPTLLLAALPAATAIRLVRQRRRRGNGLCPQCGYDLRATPDRCPECGTEPSALPRPGG